MEINPFGRSFRDLFRNAGFPLEEHSLLSVVDRCMDRLSFVAGELKKSFAPRKQHREMLEALVKTVGFKDWFSFHSYVEKLRIHLEQTNPFYNPSTGILESRLLPALPFAIVVVRGSGLVESQWHGILKLRDILQKCAPHLEESHLNSLAAKTIGSHTWEELLGLKSVTESGYHVFTVSPDGNDGRFMSTKLTIDMIGASATRFPSSGIPLTPKFLEKCRLFWKEYADSSSANSSAAAHYGQIAWMMYELDSSFLRTMPYLVPALNAMDALIPDDYSFPIDRSPGGNQVYADLYRLSVLQLVALQDIPRARKMIQAANRRVLYIPELEPIGALLAAADGKRAAAMKILREMRQQDRYSNEYMLVRCIVEAYDGNVEVAAEWYAMAQMHADCCYFADLFNVDDQGWLPRAEPLIEDHIIFVIKRLMEKDSVLHAQMLAIAEALEGSLEHAYHAEAGEDFSRKDNRARHFAMTHFSGMRKLKDNKKALSEERA